jgi:hypothetical protein
MKQLAGWALSVSVTVLAAAANAQTAVPVSDFRGPGPYAAMPPDALWPGYGPRLLPPQEIGAIARENGFAPLGNPQQRGIVYTMSVIDPAGEDGKLVIDARSGRIIRFMPAYRMGDRFNEELDAAWGPVGPLPPVRSSTRRIPRPPLPIPHVASRAATPLPKASPHLAMPEAAPAQQPAAAAKPAEPQASPLSPTVGVAKPSAQIMPTQEMPAVQGLN